MFDKKNKDHIFFSTNDSHWPTIYVLTIHLAVQRVSVCQKSSLGLTIMHSMPFTKFGTNSDTGFGQRYPTKSIHFLSEAVMSKTS